MYKYDSNYWQGAKLIKTDMKLYFGFEDSPWSSEIDRVNYQFSDVRCDNGMPMFASDFELSDTEGVKLIFTALGCVDVFINSKRVGNDEMKPGWTNYNKRTLYYEYDVSDYCTAGKNRVLLVAAPGWYQGRISNGYYGTGMPAVMAAVVSGEASLVTDENWKATCGGQICTADIWDGEYRDGRFDSYEKISSVDYDISSWKNAELCDYFDGEITPFVGPTVQVRDNLSLAPEKITVYADIKDNGTKYGEIDILSESNTAPVYLKAGQKAVVDFSQEITGWVSLKLSGTSGTAVKVRYAEFLNDSGDENRGNDGAKGSVYTINLRTAKGKTHYILAGNGEETYRPTFTFFGFRYVEISADSDVEISGIKAEVVGSATREIGSIKTSNELVNKLISNIIWGQRSNYLSIPTDCPQRDERLGWTGDAQAFSVTAAYNADVLGFFKKWLQDVRDSQSDEGAYSDISPRVSYCDGDNACAWGDAGIIIPYNLYKLYGDKSLIKEHYASMEKYIAQLIENFGFAGPIPRYGDWLAYDFCKNEYLSSAFLVHDLDLMAFMSDELGKTDRAEHYRDLREKAHGYFKNTFMKDGELIGDTQADYVVAIAFDLIGGDYLKKAGARLVQKIKENGNRLSTGFVGTYNLCLALSKIGEDNLAYTLLMQRDEPSWLYSVDQGATTIWERWNSYTLEKGFGDVGMNSFNHYAYGSVQEWMYRYMAGIETDGVGFKNILLQPRVDTRAGDELPAGQERMKWISASYDSAAGLIESAWNNEENFVYECTIPEGASATLMLPVFTNDVVINGVKHSFEEFEKENNCAVIKLGAGTYIFEEV